MTDAQRQTITKALAYLIRHGTPVPKSGKAKQERAELLQALTNAGRPSKATLVERTGRVDEPDDRQSIGERQNPPAPDASGPQILRVEIIEPPGAASAMREGTVFGAPMTGNASANSGGHEQ